MLNEMTDFGEVGGREDTVILIKRKKMEVKMKESTLEEVVMLNEMTDFGEVGMGWRRLIGSPKLQTSFSTKEPLNIGHVCGK